ncbi:MAG: C-terminal binding protein, partial [Chloroflexi bacterium]
KTVLVDYDDDLFDPPGWIAGELSQAGIEWTAGQHRSEDEVLSAARDGDVVLVQSVRPLLTAPIIEQLHRCTCIVRLGIGYDSVDVCAATEHGILVCNVPTYCVDDVADHSVALLLGSVRHIARQDRWIRDGRWDRTGARPARRVTGHTLGLIGFGRIARAVAQRVSGFGLTILAFDPFVPAAAMAAEGVSKVELDELLARSDFMSIHCPLTDETHHLLGRREFDLMKGEVFLVNTSRGPIVDELALVEAFGTGRVWGAGLDVFETEPLPLTSQLRGFDNVVMTPHVGANSEESVGDLYRMGCEIALDIYHGRWPQGVVNPEVRPTARILGAAGD